MDKTYFENLLSLSTDGIKNAQRMVKELDNLVPQTSQMMGQMTDGQKQQYEKQMKELKALKKQLKDAGTVK